MSSDYRSNDIRSVIQNADSPTLPQNDTRPTIIHNARVPEDETNSLKLSLQLSAKMELNHHMSYSIQPRSVIERNAKFNVNPSPRVSFHSNVPTILHTANQDSFNHQTLFDKNDINKRNLSAPAPPPTLPTSVSFSNLDILEESRSLTLPESTNSLSAFSNPISNLMPLSKTTHDGMHLAVGSGGRMDLLPERSVPTPQLISMGISPYQDSHTMDLGRSRPLEYQLELNKRLSEQVTSGASLHDYGHLSSLSLHDSLTRELSVPRSPSHATFSVLGSPDILSSPTLNKFAASFLTSPTNRSLDSRFIFPGPYYQQNPNQILVSSSDKTYEILGQNHISTTTAASDVHRESILPDNSRAYTDAKYFKRRLSFSRLHDEKPYDPMSRYHETATTIAEKYQPRVSPPYSQSNRIERPIPLSFQSSTPSHKKLVTDIEHVANSLSQSMASVSRNGFSLVDSKPTTSFPREQSEAQNSMWRPYTSNS